jgi:hypothetical protein
MLGMNRFFYLVLFCGLSSTAVWAQSLAIPQMIKEGGGEQGFLPDFSYAGYANGERQPDTSNFTVIDVSKHNIIANDGLDDSQALLTLLDKIGKDSKPSILQFASGRYIISSIIYFDRDNLVVRGAGSGQGGTEFYFPRPLIYAPDPPELKELRDYLVKLDKIQKEKANNIYLPFTQWAWSGGYFWTRKPGVRVKKYLDEYDQPIASLAKAVDGVQGAYWITVDTSKSIIQGQIIEVQWYNDQGENGELLQELYHGKVNNVGSHHWSFDNLALSRQQVEVIAVKGNKIRIKAPLLHSIKANWKVNIAPWEHLQQVGFEHFHMNFAYAERIAHHVEQGFNGIYLTRVYNSWIDDVKITNADSSVLLEEVANLSLSNITTDGSKYAHYSVQMGGVHNVLVDNLKVENPVEHPLSFNTFATRSVYLNSEVFQKPVLDQHSGVNHQNLFDNILVHVQLAPEQREYPLFAGGGASYWKPSHAAYNSFYNIRVDFSNGQNLDTPVLLNGMKDGPLARIFGVSGNNPVVVEYGPDAHIEGVNLYYQDVPSLYKWQLQNRLKSN